jgi:hypothetical protein
MTSERTAHEEKLSAQLAVWSAQLAVIKAKAEKASVDAKIEITALASDLQGKHDGAHAKLQELKAASDAAWGDLKAGAEHAWSDVSTSFRGAASKFK